jgi:hypothetical protein
MVREERYAEMSHGLFPRFLIGASAFALVQFLLTLAVDLLIPIRAPLAGIDNAVQPRFETLDAISALFPLAFFGMFYLISRIRVNLGTDYARVAGSIFIGSLIISLIEAFSGAFQFQGSATLLDSVVQNAAQAVFLSVEFTFAGFAAILLSYRRQM